MQTSQILNSANVLSSPAQAPKQSNANPSTQPFGQVLSREIADRGNPNKPAGDTSKTPGTQAASNSKSVETKPASKGKTKEDDDASSETADVPSNVPSNAPEAMLALVADISQIKPPALKENEAIPTAEGAQLGVDASLVVSNSNSAKVVNDSVSQLTNSVQTSSVQLSERDTQRKLESVLPGLTEHTKIQFEPDAVRPGRTRYAGDARSPLEPAISTATRPDTADSALGFAITDQNMPKGASAALLDANTAVMDSAPGMAAIQQAQHSAFQAVQTAAGHVTEKLTPQVGSPAWDQALGQKVVWMVAGEQQSASLTLNPPDLGPLQVVLNVSNSHATATFTAAQPEVRQALEAALPKLRDMLSDAGIQLGQATVNSGASNHHGAHDQHTSQPTHRLDQVDGNRNDAPVRVSRIQQTSSGQGLVDTFV